MQFRLQFTIKLLCSLYMLTIIHYSDHLHSKEKSPQDELSMYSYGVIDRIIDENIAIILLEEENIQFTLPLYELPEGSKEGTWLQIDVLDEEYIVLAIDMEKTTHKYDVNKFLIEQLKK